MKEDYLWDGSGEVDPEIESLERALGSLRYRPADRPLRLPAAAPARPWFAFRPALAAAASLLIIALAGLLWLSTRSEGLHTVSGPGKPPGPITIDGRQTARRTGTVNIKEAQQPKGSSAPVYKSAQRFSAEPRQLTAGARNERRALQREREQLRQGELAKEQLIKALHIASDKLNTVQKKIQGAVESRPVS